MGGVNCKWYAEDMKTTPMGTRVIIRPDHSFIQFCKDDDWVLFSVHDGRVTTIDLKLTQRECLAMIEYLAVAATPDSEKEVVEMVNDEATNTVATVMLPEDT